MLQLIVVYFAPSYIFGTGLGRFTAAITAMVINYACYFAEIYRGGIQSVPVGQYEASKVLGFTGGQTFFRIVLPQVVKKILPAMGNEVITLVKDTSLVQVLGVAELFHVAKTQSGRLVSVLPLFMAGVFYFAMNWVVAKIESIPYSIVKGLYVNDFEFAVLLVALLLLMLTFMLHKRRLFIAMLAALLVVMASVTIRLYGSDEQKGMTAFSLRNHTAIDFVRGGEHVLLADSTLMADESTVDYSLKGAWSKRHLSHHPHVFGLDEDYANQYVCKKSNLVSFDGKLLALWDGQQLNDSLSYRLPVDYVLVSGKQKPDVQAVVNGYDAKKLLIDGSVPRYLAEKWVLQAETLHIPYYNVGEGAIEIGF